MAANNYFSFATGNTQYGTTGTYSTGQTGYAVQHAAAPQQYTAATAAAAATRATQPTYQTYEAASHSTSTYPYAARQQASYDKTQNYYQTSNVASYTTSEAVHYPQQFDTQSTLPLFPTIATAALPPEVKFGVQAVSKPTYSSGTAGYSTGRGQAVQKAQATTQQANAGSTYMYSTSSYGGNYGAQGVNNAVAAAATTQAGAQVKAQANSWGYKKGPMKMQKPKPPPKPQQLHYCEVCKISCAGPQTYKEHLEGQKHKKKEAALKNGNITPVARGGTSLRCELCDVTCTGSDAYAAHIRGAKHQKVVKLHTKLGKPIPSTEPVLVVSTAAATSTSTSKATTTVAGVELPGAEGKEEKENKAEGQEKLDDKPDVQPVGQDYIEEIRNDEGKVISFQCKLCECRFDDPNAKEMHMKGRRHRLQYKKKVNPELVVDIKPSLRQRKLQEERLRRQLRDEFWKRREEERWREEMSFEPYLRLMEEEERMYWEERRRYEEEMEWCRWYGRDPRMPGPPPLPRPLPGPPGPMGMPMPRRPDSVDDRHVMAKHSQIYPKEEDLGRVQKIVTNTEKALKLVSDSLIEKDPSKPAQAQPAVIVKQEPGVEGDKAAEKKENEEVQGTRSLKGVMRVGVLAKGLLLTGDYGVGLVVMCSEKPTRTLLNKVAGLLPKQLSTVATDEKYDIKINALDASVIVCTTTDPKITVKITLTSPVMRETSSSDGTSTDSVKDPPDVLDRQKCLDALAALRHAKWFQARASSLQSCVMVIRILRDLCQRVPTWGTLDPWALELLVEKVLSSAGQPLGPGDALRRVLEAIAGGILLPGSPGLMDPCEKDPVDALTGLNNQAREDITASAQHALRLVAFRQIHKVLGMDPLPPPKFVRNLMNRKRRRETSAGEANESEGGDGKKDKKEEESKPEASSSPAKA